MSRPSKATKSRWYLANRETQIATQRARREAMPEVERKALTRRYHLKAKYGITPEQFDDLLASQSSLCAICYSPEPNHFRGWNLDHCHSSDNVRGVLCHHCNLLLGNARDNPAILLSAVSYLERANVR